MRGIGFDIHFCFFDILLDYNQWFKFSYFRPILFLMSHGVIVIDFDVYNL